MKYPTEIYIRGHHYRIEYVTEKCEVAEEFESDSYVGACHPDVIRVLASQSPLELLDTVIHEILHAISIRNPMLKTAIRHNIYETFISTLASDIALTLFDNDLVKFPKCPPITTRINPEALP